MKLLLALACEDARERPDGRLDFVGVFDRLQAPGFPAAQERMTVVFVMEWSPSERGRKEFQADLVDARDQKVLTITGHTDVAPASDEPERPRTRLLMPLEKVVFPHAGDYRFVLRVGDESAEAFSLNVSRAADQSRTPPGTRG